MSDVSAFFMVVLLMVISLAGGLMVGFRAGRNVEESKQLEKFLHDNKGRPFLARLEFYKENIADATLYYKRLKSFDHFKLAELIRAAAFIVENDGIKEINSHKKDAVKLRLVK